jgi:hypothetical protein
VTLTEEQLGSYPAKAGRIVIGNQVVELKPLGTFLIGARGRVDMVGPRGIARFVIVPPDAKGFTVRVSVVKPGERPTSPEKPTVPPSAWRWKLVTSPPRISYIELTQESFRDALVGVVDG